MRRIVLGAFALLLVGAVEAEAQCRRTWWGSSCGDDRRDRRSRVVHARPAVEFGVRGGFDFEEDAGTAGTQFRIPLARQLLLSPSADVLFADAATEWQVNVDALLRPTALGGVYGGAGVAFLNGDLDRSGSGETEVGANLVLGIESGRVSGTSVRPFAEGRWTTVSDYDTFRLALGINVPVSGTRR